MTSVKLQESFLQGVVVIRERALASGAGRSLNAFCEHHIDGFFKFSSNSFLPLAETRDASFNFTMSTASCRSPSGASLTLKVIKARHARVASIITARPPLHRSPCSRLDTLLEETSSDEDSSPSTPYSGTPEQDGSTSPNTQVRSSSDYGAAPRASTDRSTHLAIIVPEQAQPVAIRPLTVSVSAKPVVGGDPMLRYQIVAEIRKSLFGTVVHARDTVRNQDVAIKLSNTDLALAGISLNGFSVMENPLSEAVLLKELPAHPFIVSLQRTHFVHNVHWTVMDYMPNGDLFEYVQRSPFMAPDVGRNYVWQIAQALLHIHAHQMCHLDVSLENILLDLKANVKLTDFGVARSFADQPSSMFPGIHRAEKPGKVRYIAPELLAGQAFDGCLVDSFALGVIMFRLLVGCAPFERAHPNDLRWQLIAAGDFPGLFKCLRVPCPSASAVDLLQQLLVSADKRLSIAAVLKHPWFQPKKLLEVSAAKEMNLHEIQNSPLN